MTALVYPRDAAWWDRPGTGRAYHWPADPEDPLWAACSSRIMLSTTAGSTPENTPASLWCRRPACARRYDAG